MIELNLSELLIGTVMIGFIFIAAYKIAVYYYDMHNANKILKQVELKTEIEKLKWENKRLKGFHFIKVTDVEIGQFVSNADGVYLCIDFLQTYEKRFFDFANNRVIDISYDEVVRKREDLDTIMNKEMEETDND